MIPFPFPGQQNLLFVDLIKYILSLPPLIFSLGQFKIGLNSQ